MKQSQYVISVTADITYKYIELIKDEMMCKTIVDLQAIVAELEYLMDNEYELTSVQSDIYAQAKLEYEYRLERMQQAGLYRNVVSKWHTAVYLICYKTNLSNVNQTSVMALPI